MYIDVNSTYKPWKKYERTLIESNTIWVHGNPTKEMSAPCFSCGEKSNFTPGNQ